MLAYDVMAVLYQHNFLNRRYLQNDMKGQQNTKLTFSVSNTWFQYHLERKSLIWQVCWSSQVIPFWNTCFAIPASDFNLWFPAIRKVHPSPHTIIIGCPVPLKNFTAVKLLAVLAVMRECLCKMYYSIPRNGYYIRVHWDQFPKFQATWPDQAKYLLTFWKLFLPVKKINSRNFIFPPFSHIGHCCFRQFIKNVLRREHRLPASLNPIALLSCGKENGPYISNCYHSEFSIKNCSKKEYASP